jgi:hypothetical protein
MDNSPIERKKEDLIRVTRDPAFQREVYEYACKLTGNTMNAENYMQEALRRFISMVKNKTSLKELERIHPLPYVFMIVDKIHTDRRS